ncbi:MAG: hypothetical protein HY791_01100 [Deltaproteobacteria bacterium]|nr:hypothetical protein [Deltaproteobacteria bacterium]
MIISAKYECTFQARHSDSALDLPSKSSLPPESSTLTPSAVADPPTSKKPKLATSLASREVSAADPVTTQFRARLQRAFEPDPTNAPKGAPTSTAAVSAPAPVDPKLHQAQREEKLRDDAWKKGKWALADAHNSARVKALNEYWAANPPRDRVEVEDRKDIVDRNSKAHQDIRNEIPYANRNTGARRIDHGMGVPPPAQYPTNPGPWIDVITR